MHILFVCRFLPYADARDSGRQDKYHYIKSLSTRHNISVIGFAAEQEIEGIGTLRAYCQEVKAVPYGTKAWLPRLWRAIWRLLMPKVYGRNVSPTFRRHLRLMTTSNRYDVAIVDGPMARYRDELLGIPSVLDEVDIYTEVARQLFENERRQLHRLRLWWDWQRTRKSELDALHAYDGILVRSPEDREKLSEYVPAGKIVICPPWFEGLAELREVPLERPPGNTIIFMGAMNNPANEEAVIYFMQQVMPLIQKKVGDARLQIVGSKPSAKVKSLAAKTGAVEVTGEVRALRPYYENSAVNVVPLLTGGGIIVKTLNGLAAARPTVATVIGNSGTGARHERHLLVVEPEAQQIADAVCRLLLDDRDWIRFARAGRAYIAEAFDWEEIIQRLSSALETIAQGGSTGL